MRQPAQLPATSMLHSPHFLTIDQNTCCTAQSCVLPLWRGFRVSHQHSSEVSRELEVALACFPLKSKQPEQLRAAIAFWWRVYPLPIFSSPLGSNIFGTHTDLHQQHPAKNKPIWRTGISRTQPSLGFYDCKDLHCGSRLAA